MECGRSFWFLKFGVKEIIIVVARSAFLLSLVVSLFGCVRSNQKKKDFIVRKQKTTNDRVAKKYGELVVPDFVKNGEYDFKTDDTAVENDNTENVI